MQIRHRTVRPSWLSRRDDRWQLAAFVVGLVGVALVDRPGPAAAALAGAIAWAVLGRVSANQLVMRSLVVAVSVLPFVVLVPFLVDGVEVARWGRIAVTDHGLESAAVIALKTIALVTLATALLTASTMAHLAVAAGRLGVPRLLVQLILLTHRYTFLFIEELGRLRIALRVRGFRNAATGHAFATVGRVAGTLIVHGADRGERVAQAMRCRGFDGRMRTIHAARTTASDVLLLLATLTGAVAVVSWDRWA